MTEEEYNVLNARLDKLERLIISSNKAKSDLDLMMCPVKRTGYINIYDNNRVCKQIFETEGEAKIAGNSTPGKYIKTIKIEWEE